MVLEQHIRCDGKPLGLGDGRERRQRHYHRNHGRRWLHWVLYDNGDEDEHCRDRGDCESRVRNTEHWQYPTACSHRSAFKRDEYERLLVVERYKRGHSQLLGTR